MSVSGIPSSIFSPTQSTSASNSIQQQFQQIGQSLQSGNLSSAQSEFASLQQAFSQSVSNSTANSNSSTSTAAASSPTAQAFNQLASDLKSGDLTAAQKDYSSIQKDFRAHGGPVKNHFLNPHPVSTGTPGTVPPTVQPNTPPNGVSVGPDRNSVQNSLLQDFKQVQATSSSTPAVAQQVYSTLQQELQQFALGGNLSAESSTLLAQSAVSLQA